MNNTISKVVIIFNVITENICTTFAFRTLATYNVQLDLLVCKERTSHIPWEEELLSNCLI